MTTDPHPAPTATSDAEQVTGLLADIVRWGEAYATAHTSAAFAHMATTRAEYDRLKARAEHWDRQARDLFDAIASAVGTIPGDAAKVDKFMPVRALPNGHVQLHARDQYARPVVVGLTFAEAVSIGVHLTAYAAIGLDRTGNHVDRVLPALPTEAPVATTAAPPTGTADGRTTVGRHSTPTPSVPVIAPTTTPGSAPKPH